MMTTQVVYNAPSFVLEGHSHVGTYNFTGFNKILASGAPIDIYYPTVWPTVGFLIVISIIFLYVLGRIIPEA